MRLHRIGIALAALIAAHPVLAQQGAEYLYRVPLQGVNAAPPVPDGGGNGPGEPGQSTPLVLTVGGALPTEAMVGYAITPVGVTVSGGAGPVTRSVSGASWMSFGSQLTGTPGAADAGTYGFAISATDGSETKGASGTITVYPALSGSISADPSSEMTKDQPIAPVAMTLTGGKGPYVFGHAGSLPNGLSVSSSGVLHGTPTTAGTYQFQLTGRESFANASVETGLYTVTVGSFLTLGLSPLSQETHVGSSIAAVTPSANGTAPYTWSLASGAYPPGTGLSLAGVLSGVANEAGTFRYRLSATDSASATGQTGEAVIIVHPAVTASFAAPPPSFMTVGEQIAPLTLVGGGGKPGSYTYSVGGIAGLGADPATGTVIGAPSAPGTFSLVGTARDSLNKAGSTTPREVVVSTPLAIPTTGLSVARGGLPYNSQVNVSGGRAPYTWTLPVPGMPSGFSTSAAIGSGLTISGTTSEGTSRDLAFTVTDADGRTLSKSLNLEIIQGAPPADLSLLSMVTTSGIYGSGNGLPPYQVGDVLSPSQRGVGIAKSNDASGSIGFNVNGASASFTYTFSEDVVVSALNVELLSIQTGVTINLEVRTGPDASSLTSVGSFNYNGSSPGATNDSYNGGRRLRATSALTQSTARVVRIIATRTVGSGSFIIGPGAVN